jgi:putative flippase GtrA
MGSTTTEISKRTAATYPSGAANEYDSAHISDDVVPFENGRRARRFIERFLPDRIRLRRIVRYASTSAISTIISETVLLSLFANHILGAISSALLATVAGTLPSYFLSRYWIWPEADRKRPARQVTAYWVISFVALAVSSGATGLGARLAPHHGATRDIVVGTVYLGTYGLLWLGRFIVYQRFVFLGHSDRHAVAASAFED